MRKPARRSWENERINDGFLLVQPNSEIQSNRSKSTNPDPFAMGTGAMDSPRRALQYPITIGKIPRGSRDRLVRAVGDFPAFQPPFSTTVDLYWTRAVLAHIYTTCST